MERHHLTRREFIALIGSGATALAASECLNLGAANAAARRKPNILVIVSDDQGYAEMGCHGCKDIPTPNLDAMAAGGVRFTNGYVSCPVCSPTRAGLITGRYQQRFGHEFNPGGAADAAASFGLPLSETTIASRLRSAGYATGMVGKWHLGYRPGYMPTDRGFDEFFGFLGGAHQYFAAQTPDAANPIMRGTKQAQESEYLTDAFAREAVAFIERHKSEPFFLFLTFNAVHGPLQAPRNYENRFPDIKDQKRRTFAAMLSALDDAVGHTLRAVRDSGLDEDTLVFFVSDNGGPTRQTTSRNDPLRGFKGEVYEGGIRVPFMVRWTGQIPAGKVYDRPVISLDIAPTALAAAGASAGDAKFDGVDLIPYLTGASEGAPHGALYWRFGQQYAIREGGWKLVKRPGSGHELFDLDADVGEKNNLAAQNADRVRELDERLTKWDSELAKPLWGPRAARPRAARRTGGG